MTPSPEISPVPAGHRRTPLSVALLVLATAALAGCGSSSTPTGATAASAADVIDVAATDTSCGLSRTDLTAGRNVFRIKNTGSQVTEVYVYAAGDAIVTEKENIGPGLSYELTADVPAGAYEVACKPGQTGDGIRTPITVAAAGAAPAADPATEAAVTAYRAYVQEQADALVSLVEEFAAAVEAGDVAEAKGLYAPSRVPWEAIEPVAEAFGDLDPEMDLREADLEPGQEWTGWHRIEKALWKTGSTKGMAPVADALVEDARELQGRVATADITAVSIGNGAKELLDEVATGKVTGEEEAFSHTDLVDFAANVAGAEKAFEVLRPLAKANDPALVTTLEAAFGDVDAALARYEDGDGYVSYDTVRPAQRRELAQVVDALGEPLSQLAAATAR